MEDEQVLLFIPNPSGIFIPSKILDKNVSPSAKILFGLLIYFADEDGCSPKQKDLALEMGCSQRQVQRYIKELVDSNLIQVKHPSPQERHQGKSNEYFLTKESNYRTYRKGDYFNGRYYINN